MEPIETSYQEALDYIYHFVDYSLTRSFRFSPEKFDLNRMHQLLALMGDPHKQFKCIHVAETKGKGSVSALIANVLKSAGYATGLYTSPHLQDYCERIQINGKLVTHGEFADLVNEIKPFVARIDKLTTFEISTALAFMYFARKNVEIAVVEVGLGGRLDATNVVDPLISVITSISYDHMDILGNTLTQIAGEKAGIIKNGRPVFISRQTEEAFLVFERISRERNSPFFPVDAIYDYVPLEHSLKNQTFFIHKKGEAQGKNIKLSIPLLGIHQIENAVTAYAALKYIGEIGVFASDEAIYQGFDTVFWPARFEVLHQDLPTVIIDSAHNRDSAKRLRETLDDYLPGRQVILIFGASEDKDVDGMFDELAPRISRVIATRSIHPRAMSLKTILEVADKYHLPALEQEPVEDALEYAMKAADQRAIVLVAGSLFVSAATRDAWTKMGLPLRSY